MKINPQIKDILAKYQIDESAGLIYLLCIFFGVDAETVPEVVKKQVNLARIVERDHEAPGNILWKIPLFEGQILVDTKWEWIEEWRGRFGKIRNDAIGSKQDCYSKMKKFFAKNPEVRKEDIFRATEMYLHEFQTGKTPPKFLQKADYFISKIVKAEGGTQHGSRLEMYLEILQKEKGSGNPVASRQLNQVVR